MSTVPVPQQIEDASPELVEAAPLGPRATRLALVAGGLGAAALVAAYGLASLGPDGARRFSYAYLTSFVFFLTVSLGGLFFVLLQHLTKAGWSVVVRRLAELFAANLGLLAVLALVVVAPVLAKSGVLYPWADPARAQADPVIAAKHAYLAAPFFTARVALYFALWILLARWYLARSSEQDRTGEVGLTSAMERRSAPAMLVFALTVTFAAFDLVMSLDPSWYSTIFGVYLFAGSAMSFFAALALALAVAQAGGRLRQILTVEHYHDVGKLLFAFVFFWGYIAFSQFLLIWYANIPEETRWYHDRMQGGWGVLALALLFGHFLVPFAGLLSRTAKRNKKVLGAWAAFLLLMHWIDVYWLVGPAAGASPTPGGVDVLCFLGLGGLYAGGLLALGRKRALVPLRDPRLGESVGFENA